MTRRNLTFVIADDHPVIRISVRSILEDEGFQVLAEAADGPEAVRLCRACKPDLVILDFSMPGLNGIEAAREIKRDYPASRIILLTMQPLDGCLLQGLRAGVMGYVSKKYAASGLLKAIDAVCRGETYMSSDQAA